MKIILSVSKKHNSIWKIYYNEYDDYEEKYIFKSERINRLLVPYYKLQKFHRRLVQCNECDRIFQVFWNWRHKILNCPYCLQ